MSVEIIPTDAVLGAEIRGVDLARPLDNATFCEIERAFNAHAVIFFRDQRITPPQQVAFTRRFGEIEFNVFGERWSVPGSPEIVVVSNATEDGRPIGVRRAGENWHILSSRENPKICGIDDAEVVGDLVAVDMPVPRHLLAQKS
ncbi:MAG: TauD/TfdA dioxygenase family protein [Acetobacteraceae bacterium]